MKVDLKKKEEPAYQEAPGSFQDVSSSAKKVFFTTVSQGPRAQAFMSSLTHDSTDLRNQQSQPSKLGMGLLGYNNPLLSKQIVIGQKAPVFATQHGLGDSQLSSLNISKRTSGHSQNIQITDHQRAGDAEQMPPVSNLERSQKLLERLEGISGRRPNIEESPLHKVVPLRSGAQSVKAVRTSGASNPLGEWSLQYKKQEGSQYQEEGSAPRNLDFLSGLDRLKNFNSNGTFSKDVPRLSQQRAMSAHPKAQDGSEVKMKQPQTGLNEARAFLAAETVSNSGSTTRSHLDQKRKDLHENLNKILDRLGSATSVKGETKSVAPATRPGLDNGNDDNLSLNSFHSSTPMGGNGQRILQAGLSSTQQGTVSSLQ